MALFTIIEIIFVLYFLYVVLYTLVSAIASLFYKSVKPAPATRQLKFAVFIPAYKEDAVILDVAKRALNQTYPASSYDVIVIADSLQPATLQILRGMPIKVVEVSFESSTKVKSLGFALQQQTAPYDCAVILDADNVMEETFLEKMNALHQQGYKAIQGQRVPKNKDNTLALLDGISEAINNAIYRQGNTALGLSASINGSAISFDYTVFKELMLGMTSVGGFDRELELLLLQRGIKVYYYKDAHVLDEKVQKTAVFENQRKRWISSQYHYLGKYFGKGMGALLRGNLTFFNSSVLRNIQLPRLINLGLLTVLVVVLFFVRDYLAINYWLWPSMLAGLVLAMALAIPREYYNADLFKALLKLPGLFLRMFLLLFRLGGANKKFIHTPHYTVDLDKTNK